MMSDSEDFKMLDSLMRENELLFRLGITHLMSVGYENMTEEVHIEEEAVDVSAQETVTYTHVDIRL